jgi:hypothetical protein
VEDTSFFWVAAALDSQIRGRARQSGGRGAFFLNATGVEDVIDAPESRGLSIADSRV